MSAVEYEQVDLPEPLPAGEPVEAQPGENIPAAGSLQAKVQAARAHAQQSSTTDIEIPGYDGTLWGTFRAIDDFKERMRIEKRWQRVRSEAQRVLDIQAEMLRVACLDCFVPAESFVPGETKAGDRFSLQMTLGVQLAAWLDVLPANAAGIVNDHECIFPPFIFPSTLAIGMAARELHAFSARVGEQADEDAEGNSMAPNSRR